MPATLAKISMVLSGKQKQTMPSAAKTMPRMMRLILLLLNMVYLSLGLTVLTLGALAGVAMEARMSVSAWMFFMR